MASTSTTAVLGLNGSSPVYDSHGAYRRAYHAARRLRSKAAANSLERLNNTERIDAHAVKFQTRYQVLILVSDSNDVRNPPYYIYDNLSPITNASVNPYGWLCGQSERFHYEGEPLCSELIDDIDRASWAPFQQPTSYCLADAVDQRCELCWSPLILWVRNLVSLMKALILGFMVYAVKKNPLLTLGDAVNSSLRDADVTPENLCLMGMEKIHIWCPNQVVEERRALPHEPVLQTCGQTVAGYRWGVCITWYVIHLGFGTF